MKHLPALDGLRGLAVMLVIVFHFGFLEAGWTGVQIFFVLSGYLITSILVRESSLDLPFYLKRFYWRRALRIFPLYYLYLTVVGLVFCLSGEPSVFGRQWPYLFSYSFNFLRASPHYQNSFYLGHFWSLGVEEQFYLFWPLLMHRLSPEGRRRLVFILIAGCPVFRLLAGVALGPHMATQGLLGQAIDSITACQLDAFAFGALVALNPSRDTGRAHRTLTALSLLLLLVGVANIAALKGRFTLDTSLGYPINLGRNVEFVWGYTLLDAWAASVIQALRRPGWLSRIFASPTLVQVGKISYGMYVYHLAVQRAVWMLMPYPSRSLYGLVAFALDISLVWCLAWASYSLFESRFLALKERRFTLREAPGLSWNRSPVLEPQG
jgi:peptidoglycan/LPS O-acetylase OafA/YrhL